MLILVWKWFSIPWLSSWKQAQNKNKSNKQWNNIKILNNLYLINEITVTLLIVLHSVSVKTPTLQDPKIIKMSIDVLEKAVENGELGKVQELLQQNKYTDDEKSQILEKHTIFKQRQYILVRKSQDLYINLHQKLVTGLLIMTVLLFENWK